MKQEIGTLVLFWIIPLTSAGEISVTCFFSADCVLPCNSTHRSIVIIRWSKEGKENTVHSFYNNDDHLEQQDSDFRGRTSLWRDRISQGNVSLLLRGVRVEDGGVYTCFTSSRSEQMEEIVHLDVKAPIKKVEINLEDEGISCRTSSVYPKPVISWFKGQETIGVNMNISVETHEDEQGLFSLMSVFTDNKHEQHDTKRNQSLKRNPEYTCSISFQDKSQTYYASLRHDKVNIYSGQNATIHCPVPHGDAGDYTITLRYEKPSINLKLQQTNTSFNRSGRNVYPAHGGNVALYDLDMNKDAGTYICEMFTAGSITKVMSTMSGSQKVWVEPLLSFLL